ncbi:tandem-95 repeat protein [Gymnodinialimonas sp.]
MTNFNEPNNVADLIGLWDFLSGNENADTGLDDGIAQDGNAVDGNGVSPSFSNGQLHVGAGSNSSPTVFDVNADSGSSADDAQFNLDRGTLEVQFTQSSQSGGSEDVILSRGEKHIDEDDEGFFEIRVTGDGKVQSYHNTDDGDHQATLSTSAGFFSPGDVVNVKYSFDEATGARLTVENLTTGAVESLVSSETGLTFDLTDNDDEEFTFGAREKDDGEYDKEFQGAIDYVALYTTTNDPVTNPNPTEPNYIVEGTSGGELIDAGYTGDPEGDMIDALDNDLTPPNNDDVVEARGGDDTVQAGDGDDTVSGGTGNDLIFGDDDNSQAGDDLLLGEEGDDTLCGVDGDDTLDGGAGDDTLEGMAGDDLILGGSGNDLGVGDTGNDTIFGDAGGQDNGSVREVFQWDLAPNTGAPNFSQDTGNVTVTFSETDGGASDEIATDAQNVAGIDTGPLGAVDDTSSLDSETGGEGNSDTYSLGFSDPVENVSFRVNDIDGDGVVRVQAFDANGDPIEVILEGGSNLTLLDTDGVAGADTADSQGGYLPDTSSEYSILVTIPGPVSEIQIFHTQDGDDNSGVNVTDVYFDVPGVGATEGDGDDTLIGGAGDDLIYGNGGDDSIEGNSGDDTLFGDDPEEGTVVSGNLIFNGSFEITSGMTTTGFGFRGEAGDGVPGWTEGNGGEIDFHNDGRGGINPTDGQNWLDLEASPGNSSVGQVVDGVQDGETYKLTFDAGDKSDEPQSGSGENLIEVYWGGELIATVDPEAGQMDEYTFNVIGGAGDGSNKLEFVGKGAEDNFGASIDNVELVQLAGAPGEGGDDTIKGGTGNDLIDGQGGDDSVLGGAGDDTITGGDGADSLSGGDDRDTFLGGNDGDTVDGGTGSTSGLDEDDFDVLDLTGEGPFRIINETEDADGDSTSGTIQFLNADGTPNGDTLDFFEIEEIRGEEVNDDPNAVDDTGSGDEDTDITGNVLDNDSDPNGDPLQVISNTDPSNGSVVIDADGNYTYTPDPDYNGPDSFTYTVSDGMGGEATATVNLTVNPVNDAPDAMNDSVTTPEETEITIDALGNDTDVDGDTLVITGASVPTSQGTVDIVGNQLVFTPAENFNGPATISYAISDGNGGTDTAEVTVDVTPVNDDPVAVDDNASTMEDESVVIDLIGNDTDVDGDTLELAAVSVDPALGTVVDNGDGTVTFTPAPDYNGPVTIDYTVSDGNGGTDDGQAFVTVGSVNDGPTAVDDSASTDEDTDVTFNVIGNDTDPDGDTLEVVGATVVDPATGTVTNNNDGTLTFTPALNYNGPAEITYTISDGNGGTDTGTVNVTVNPVNDDPVAVDDIETTDEDVAVVVDLLGNDSDVDGDTLVLQSFSVDPAEGTAVDNGDGTVTFTPALNFNGPATITYVVSDGNGGTDTGEAIVSVGAVNDGPVAGDDTATTEEDTAITLTDVLDNDSDADGDPLTIIDVTVPTDQGTVTTDGTNVTFTPAENFNGPAEITYTISDGNGGTDTGTIAVDVTPVNDDPDAVDDSDSTEFETAVEIDLLANDTDVDNPASDLVVTSATVDPAEGTLTPTGTEGVFTFTPADGFEGTATVSYTISDGAGGTDSAVHTIEVGADPTPQDGIVDGEESGEEMILGYDDSNLPTDQGGDIITDGDDTIEGNGGDDTINGAGGDDDIDGGEGADVIAGGEGDDTLKGGAGDDDISVGGNDEADGGTGDDVFTVDTTDPAAPVDVTIDGGSDGTDGNPDGPENGDEGDVLDLGDQTADLTVEFEPNPEEGTVNGLDADDDDLADITFEEIEKVITGSGDDVVNGEDADGPIDVETGDGDDDVTGGDGDDTIDTGDGDDDVEAGDGDDSVTAGDGDDDVEGGDGDDTIDGGDGSDTLAGGEGDDEIDGGDGDDDIEVGAGDTAEGGIGDDVFTVDDTLTGDSPITVDGGSDGTQPGDEAGPENGDEGDTLDLRGLDLVSLVFDPTDPEAGTAVYNNDVGDPVTLTFTEIENVLHDPLPDGAVDGEEFGEEMNPGYDDGNLPTDNGGDIIDGPDGLDDTIFGNGGNDTINAGLGSDTVSGGEGDDSIFGGATDDADVIDGDDGNDTLQGGGGDDTLDGGADDDKIEGGTGNDDITGGDGNDDVSGGEGNDVIDTSGSAPATDLPTPNLPPFLTGAPGDTAPADDKDTVDGGAGNDSITTGDDADVIFGGTGMDTIDGGIDADTIDGGADADSIIGGEGSDSIVGGGGNDTIYGGLDSIFPDVLNVADDGFNSPIGPDPVDNNGDDFIDGGQGNDLIFGQDDDDTILGGTGDDTIDGGVDNDSILGGQGEDSIEGGHGQDFIQGNNDNDMISGGRGSDTLEGNAGDDTIIGGSGDSIVGGGGADSIFIDQDEVDENGDADAAIFVEGNTFGVDDDTLDLTDFVAHRNLVETPDGDGDSTSGSVEVQNDAGDWVEVTFNEIETLLLPPQAPDLVVDGEEFGELMDPLYDDADGPTDGGGDIIDGPDGDDDSIRGNGGDDTINAGAGNDTVDGGADNDTVNGQTGNDIVDGGDGNDLVTGGFGDDTVLGGDGDDTLRGNQGDDSLVGGDGNDSMGGAEDDDTLEGGAGEDTLTGGSGNDVLDGGLDDDTLNGSSGNDTITDLDGDNLVNSGIDGLPDLGTPFVPDIIGKDADPNDDRDSITTGDGDDTINSGDDADTIDAGDGDNVIDGGFDDDIITSGDGNDEILGGEGSDTINSGDGDDTIQGGIGTDAANLIDDNVNPANNDPILDNGDDLINAGAGNDLVFGEDDNDTIDGGEGNDTLDGGIDDDTIMGGDGNDEIIGGQGADSLDGGLGDDTFNVGTFTDPVFGDEYKEGLGDTIVGGEDPGDGDVDVLDLTGSGSLKVVFDDGIDPTGTPGESGTVIFYTDNTQTTIAGTLEFKEIENVIPCFTPGAMIATPRGEVPVETLREGDKVITRDNGIQEIRWTGNRTLNRTELAEGDNLKPILIKAGSLGRNLPERDMLVSPQHRVLITGESPQLYFEESEVLVAAKHLVGKQGVSVVDTMRTTYIHFMFDRHEVVLSDGAWTESFQPGDQTLGSMGEATREEIFALFPELATQGGLTDYAAARRSLKAHEAKLLRL